MSWEPDPEHQAQIDAMLDRQQPGGWRGERPKSMINGLLHALVSRDLLDGERFARWHVSVSHRDRIPTWEEVAAAGHELRPGVVFVIGIPPKSWWINVHPHVLHLFELRDEALIAQWRSEGRGDRPT